MREMKTIVCELLTNFDIQLIAPTEMTIQCSTIFLTRPSNEIRLRLIPNNVTVKPLPLKREPEEKMETEALEQTLISSNSSNDSRAHQQPPTMNGSGHQQLSNGFEVEVEESYEHQRRQLASEKPLVVRETSATSKTMPMRRKTTIIDNIAQSSAIEEEDNPL